ncbi:hypothetical protein FLK61_40805 [Paenalkalicoccus suaedae]|uniref:Uncharacterized protein n=1 Tax=Paenalkalicoccus suaedae TaxID=2592382 RepID=A0A859FJG1_9BACI|nr:hypothetical protein [Paenalkalicoccus suaedae]QKS72942.1 hypothetical protein FLK61_40805 [Paenalkalicoccus suaedae]
MIMRYFFLFSMLLLLTACADISTATYYDESEQWSVIMDRSTLPSPLRSEAAITFTYLGDEEPISGITATYDSEAAFYEPLTHDIGEIPDGNAVRQTMNYDEVTQVYEEGETLMVLLQWQVNGETRSEDFELMYIDD